MNESISNPAFPQRTRLAHPLPVKRGNRSIIIFLTVCVKNRRAILANEEMHGVIRSAWIAADHWLVGRYMIMPDHVHLFCAPGMIDVRPFEKWERYWKSKITRAVGASEGTFWQKDYWDTQLRDNDSYAAKWEYVRQNPLRAGLVKRSEDWPYQGELNILRWHA